MTQIVEHPEVLLYTRIRKSPYFYASRRHGVKSYSFYNHMYHPRHYGDPVEEYWQLVNGVTLWDVGVERQVEITGADAFQLANLLVPRDLTKCEVGQCKYVFITGADGGIINDPVLLRLAENHFWISVADSDVLLWAMGVAYNSGLDVLRHTPDFVDDVRRHLDGLPVRARPDSVAYRAGKFMRRHALPVAAASRRSCSRS